MISPPPPAPGSTPDAPPAAPVDAAPAATAETGEVEGEAEGDEKEKGLSPAMYDKLRAEATTPFRSLRLFVYGGFGVGAGLGGFTAVTQFIKSAQGYVRASVLLQIKEGTAIVARARGAHQMGVDRMG